VEAFLLAAVSPAAFGRVFNLGGCERVSLRQLADLLIDVHGGGRCVTRAYPPDRRKIDIGDFYSDYGLIERTLGWRPRTRLPIALARTLAYYRRNLRYYV
jgi:nucleoside-diphosphate-sugar epimerase